MKKEINILKKKYQRVSLPRSLEASGLENLWERVDRKQYFQSFYVPRFVIAIILICILATGFIGAASASKPGSALYPIKVLSQKVVRGATRVFAPNTPTPTPAAIQRSAEPEDKNRDESTGHDSSNNEVKPPEQNNKNENPNNGENVKGAETKPGNNGQEKSSEANKSPQNNHGSEQKNRGEN